jgi:hypothetical protein
MNQLEQAWYTGINDYISYLGNTNRKYIVYRN